MASALPDHITLLDCEDYAISQSWRKGKSLLPVNSSVRLSSPLGADWKEPFEGQIGNLKSKKLDASGKRCI